MYLNTVCTNTHLCCLNISILDGCCLHTHICAQHQKQDIKNTKRLLLKFASYFLNRSPCFHKCEGHLTKHFAWYSPKCTDSAWSWSHGSSGVGFRGCPRTSGAVIKLRFLTYLPVTFLIPLYLKRKASLLSSKASLHDHILNIRNLRKPWNKDLRAQQETHLHQY